MRAMPLNGVHGVDEILVALGPKGRYQKLQTIMIILSVFPGAYQLLSNIFTSQHVPHHCAHPENESAFLHQFHGLDNLTVTYGQCDITVRSNATVVREDACIFGMAYDLPVDASAVSQFDLVCDSSSLARLSQSLVIAGQGVGVVIITFLNDRVGRKRVLVGSNLCMLVTGLVIAYAPNYIVFAICKFIAGGFQQGLITGLVTFLVEMFPTKDRRLAAVTATTSWAFGTISLALISFLLRDCTWRTVQMVYSLASLGAFFQLWYLDESIRWLFANGKIERATECIKRAARINKKKPEDILSPDLLEEVNSATSSPALVENNHDDTASGDTGGTKRITLLDVMKHRRLLVNVLVLWFTWFTTSIGFFALYLTSTSLSSNRFLSFFLTALMELPAGILIYLYLNRLGRKICLGLSFVALSLGVLLSGVFQSMEDNHVYHSLALVASLMAMVGASLSFGIIYDYTGECFPTNIRCQAIGVSSCVGRIGGMLAPFTGVLAEEGKWAPGVLIGCCSCAVCFLLLLLPETKERKLPQTIPDVLKWYSGEKMHTDEEIRETKAV